jgi:hypothetical protein
MVMFQRRRVIAPSIAPGRIFFNKPLPAGFVAEKSALAENSQNEEEQSTPAL